VIPAASVPSDSHLSRSEVPIILGLLAGGLCLYITTLAPTVLWGDDATLQLAAVDGQLRASAGSHPAWVALAHLLTALPIGDLAYRVNLLSALAGAATLGLFYLVLRAVPVSRPGSALATIAFAVSHTFWAHAVRAEVYTLTLAAMGLMVAAGLYWQRTDKDRYLVLTGLAIGFALTTHVLAVLYLPALAWLFVARRRQLTRRGLVGLVMGAVLSLLPLAYLLWRDAQLMHWDLLTALRWALFTFEGYDFSSSVFRFSAASLATDAAQWAVFLGYQFPGPALLLGIAGIVLSWHRVRRDVAIFVALLYLVPAAFAFSYQVGDRYVFFLPSYLAFGIWLGIGIDALLEAWKTRRSGAAAPMLLLIGLAILLIVTPVTTHRLTPDIMARLGLVFREGRRVPGPNSRYLLLWPPKAGYTDARNYAEAALASAPANTLLLTDPILAAPMHFLQRTENDRTDVTVRFCCWDIDAVLQVNTDRPIALADIDPQIYPVERLQRDYRIIPRGSIFVLVPFDK
jgi:hypothetical protein